MNEKNSYFGVDLSFVTHLLDSFFLLNIQTLILQSEMDEPSQYSQDRRGLFEYRLSNRREKGEQWKPFSHKLTSPDPDIAKFQIKKDRSFPRPLSLD